MKLTLALNNAGAVTAALTKLTQAFKQLNAGKKSFLTFKQQRIATEKKVSEAVQPVDDIVFGALLIGAEFENTLGLTWDGEVLKEDNEGNFQPRINCKLTEDQKQLLADRRAEALAQWSDDGQATQDFGAMVRLKGTRMASIPKMEGAVDSATGKPKLVIGCKFEWQAEPLKKSKSAQRFLGKAVDPRKRLLQYCKDNSLALNVSDGQKTLTAS